MYVQIELPEFLVIAGAATGIDPIRLRRATNIPLAESALAAPYAGFGSVRFYDDPIERAAILCSRIVRNHPLPDGNKRAGYLAMKYQLLREGIEWSLPDEDDAVLMVEGLAAKTVTEAQFVAWVRSNCLLH